MVEEDSKSAILDDSITVEINTKLRRLEQDNALLTLENAKLYSQISQLKQELAEKDTIIAEFSQYTSSLPKYHQEAFLNFFEDISFPMWVFDKKTLKFVWVNQAAQGFYGYSYTEFLNMTILDIRPDEEATRLLKIHIEHGTEKFSFVKINQHRKKDGTLVWVNLTFFDRIFGEDDLRLIFCYDVIEQVTNQAKLTEFTKELEQKVAQRTGELEMANQKLRAETLELHKTQKALQDSTTMLNAIFDSTSQAFMLLDLNLNVLALNKKIDELTKPPYQPLKVGDNLLTYVPPRNREYLLDSFAQVLAGKSVVREREIYSPEGVRIGWFEYIYNPVFDEQGKVVAVCLCYNNIEQRKLAEFQIRHNAEKMHLLGEITEALAKVDLDYANIFELAAQRIAQLFEAECAIFQLSPQEDFLQLEGLFTVNSTDSLLMNSFRTVQFKVPPVFEQSIILNNVSARSLISRILPDFESEPAKVQVLFKRQLNSLMTPIKVNNKFRGIISLSNTALDKSFLPEDGDFLKEIADRVGLAIQNVNLRKELKSRDQLEAVHALARTLAHDLTQPLTILQGELDFILQLGESPSDEVLEAMQEAVTQITNKVRQYQKIIRYRTTEGPIGQMVE